MSREEQTIHGALRNVEDTLHVFHGRSLRRAKPITLSAIAWLNAIKWDLNLQAGRAFVRRTNTKTRGRKR